MPGTVDDNHARKLDELDQLLNDPNVSLQPALIWRLIDDVINLNRCLSSSDQAPAGH